MSAKTKEPAYWLGDLANLYGEGHNETYTTVGGFVLEVIDDAKRTIALSAAALQTDETPPGIVQDALDSARNRLERAYEILKLRPEFRVTKEEPPVPFVPNDGVRQ